MKTVTYNDVLYRAAELAGRTRDKLPLSEAKMLQGFFATDLQDVWNSQPWPELIPDFYQASPAGRAISKQQGASATALSGQAQTDGSVTATFTTTISHGLQPGDTVVISGGAGQGMAYFDGTYAVATVVDATNFTYVIVAQNSASGANGLSCQATKRELGDILGVFTANPRVTTRYRDVPFTEGDNTIWLDENLALVWVEFMVPMPDLMGVADNALGSTTIPAIFSHYLALRAAGHLLRSDSQFAAGDEMLSLAETTLAAQIRRLPASSPWRQVRLRGDYARSPARTGG